MPAPIAIYVVLAAGFAGGWATRSATQRRQLQPVPVRSRTRRS